MSGTIHTRNKELIRPLRQVLYDTDSNSVQAALSRAFHKDAKIHLAYPLEDLDGAEGLYAHGFLPLHAAIPDLSGATPS